MSRLRNESRCRRFPPGRQNTTFEEKRNPRKLTFMIGPKNRGEVSHHHVYSLDRAVWSSEFGHGHQRGCVGQCREYHYLRHCGKQRRQGGGPGGSRRLGSSSGAHLGKHIELFVRLPGEFNGIV